MNNLKRTSKIRPNFLITKFCSNKKESLIEKKLLSPENLSSQQVKLILRTASELRNIFKRGNKNASSIKGARIILLMKNVNIFIQTAVTEASNMLDTKLMTIIDSTWDESACIGDIGKYLELHSDVVLLESKYQTKLYKMTYDLKIPVLSVKSIKFNIVSALNDMVTLQDHHGELKGLNLVWIGQPNDLLNTYLYIAPLLGLNINYYCSCGYSKMSPLTLHAAKEICVHNSTDIKECEDEKSVFENADIIVISAHEQNEMKVTLERLKLTNINCCILPSLARGSCGVDPKVIEHKNCLLWKKANNYVYMYLALLLKLLHN